MQDDTTKQSTRERIKGAAQRLIAEHGVDGVSVRDMVVEAGQKNMASLHYYFGSKEELIKELVIDASKQMEGWREQALRSLLESPASFTLEALVKIIVGGAVLDPGAGGRDATVMRFLGAVVSTHRHLYDEAIGKKYNKSYQKCLELIRKCLPHIPLPVLNQRLLFMSISHFNILVAREGGLASGGHARNYWAAPHTLRNLVDYTCAALSAPVSAEEGIDDGKWAQMANQFAKSTR